LSSRTTRAAPDGYTLLLASQTNAISATLYTKLAYDPVEDFAPVSLIGREPGVLVVNPALPVKTFAEFVAYVKARPGEIDYASSGNGSGQHLFAARLASSTGLKMNHIPYKGSGQATTDLLGGQVMVSIPGTAGMVGHIKAGKLRALAVTGAKRSPQLPDVPTVMESGVPGFEAYVWMGLLAPKGTPQAIIDRLYNELVPVLASPEVKAYMATAGIEIVGSTPAEFGTFFRAEKDLWAKVVRETGAKID
jgi:tripartite-type tricarboxylate transporter receptor subunit TctC